MPKAKSSSRAFLKSWTRSKSAAANARRSFSPSSVRTQKYLAGLLTANGYAGQIVLLNGSNSDPESQALYRAWFATHKGTDVVSGSKSADMKAAVVDAFRSDEKTILIATESGAEGINLQFCSLLGELRSALEPAAGGAAHRPLPPLRPEDRRDRGEYAESAQQGGEARSRPSRPKVPTLFRCVWGKRRASLALSKAASISSARLSRQCNEAAPTPRSKQEFEKIEEQLSGKIAADMQDARRKLFDAMDRDVVARLRGRGEEINSRSGCLSRHR